MSLLADESSKYPSFTLRKHTHPITALKFIRVPITTTKKTITIGNKDSNNLISKPYLISVDESGRLLLWDLVTHRSIIDVKVHEKQVMTIEQLGLNDDLTVSDPGFFGMFLTHGRDHVIKFWKLFDEFGVIFEDLKLIYELPVNALNFSNVDICGDLLVSPNTMNSNAFDIYDIGFIRQEENVDERRLKRLYEAVDVYGRTLQDGIELKEFSLQRDDDEDVNRVDKFGIIMKLLWISRDLLYVGYESGHIVCLKLSIGSGKFEIISVSSHHFPNPVLSLSYDSANQVVISTSIRSELVIHDIDTNRKTLVSLEKFGKVSSVVNIEDTYVLSSWNGYIKFFKFDKASLDLSFLSSFKKPRGMITGDLNVIGNLQDDSRDLKNKNITKPNNLTILRHQEIPQDYLRFISRRDIKILPNDFLSIGYDDGTIMTYINPTTLNNK